MAETTMKYVIEGTVKELEVKKEEEEGKEKVIWSFKITGTDGYALRQKKKKDNKETRLNVLCLENTQVDEDKKPRNAITFAEDESFMTGDEYGNLLALALANGRKCRICFSVTENGNDFNSNSCTISSLALLAE